MEKELEKQNKISLNYKTLGERWSMALWHDYADENEYRLICRIMDKDEEAFGRIVVQYQRIARKWARQIAYDAFNEKLYGYDEDIVQEMFAWLADFIPNRFKMKETKFETACVFYKFIEVSMYIKLANLVRDHIGKTKSRNEESLEGHEELGKEDDGYDLEIYNVEINNVSVKVKNEEAYEDLEGALEEMSPKQKEVFEIAITTEHPYVVIGGMTDLSEKTVRNYMSSAYKILRKHQKNRNKKKS